MRLTRRARFWLVIGCLAIICVVVLWLWEFSRSTTARWGYHTFMRDRAFGRNNVPEAEREARLAVKLLEDAGWPSDKSVSALEPLCMVLTAQMKHGEARPFLEKLIELRESDPSSDRLSLAADKLDLGWGYLAEHNHAKAEPLFKEALEICAL